MLAILALKGWASPPRCQSEVTNYNAPAVTGAFQRMPQVRRVLCLPASGRLISMPVPVDHIVMLADVCAIAGSSLPALSGRGADAPRVLPDEYASS